MKVILATLAAALLLAAAIIGFAPASLIDDRLAALSQGTLRAGDLTGTLWRGRGTLTAPDGRWQVPIAWQLQPLPLLRGTVSIALGGGSDTSQAVRGSANIATGRIVIDGLDVRIPAMVLASISGPAISQLGGEIDMRIDKLVITPEGASGGVAARWHNARIAPPGRPAAYLGSLSGDFTGRGKALSGPLTSAGGAVLVKGSVSLDSRRITVDARLTPASDASPQVRESLASLGAADANGAVIVRVERSTY